MRPDDKNGEGDSALPDITGRRMIGTSPDGTPVNNVTKKNEAEVNENNPWLFVMIWDEDLKNPMFPCYIPNTRRMPDIILLGGVPHEAWDTTKKPPVYRKCMVAQAITTQEKDIIDGKTEFKPDRRRLRHPQGVRNETPGNGE